MKKIFDALKILVDKGSLPENIYRPHKLSGDRRGQWECHINGRNSDWLMVWEQNNEELILIMINTGTHSDIFKKKFYIRRWGNLICESHKNQHDAS